MTAPGGLLTDLTLRRRYATGRQDVTREFFVPCLERSVRYDRAVGFFSSTFYALVDAPLADFAERGGRIRLVCSPHLSREDVEAIAAGYARRAVGDAVLRELDALVADPVGNAAATLLGTLIAAEVVEIRLAFNVSERGIFHDKVGVFTDAAENRVAFSGSANETWSAWSGLANHESFHAFESWTPEGAEHVAEDVDSFEALWTDREPAVEVVDFPEVARERLVERADPEGVRAAQERLADRTRSRAPRPVLRKHQEEAVANWVAAGHRGILEHATGSGKTITALSCIDVAFGDGRPALVLVPSQALLRQWRDAARGFFGDEATLLLAGAGYGSWRTGSVVRDLLTATDRKALLVATMDTAASPAFRERVGDIERLLLVADEVHRIGSPSRRALLGVEADWRLGLSATWEREGDPVGTRAIEGFFERVIEPPYKLADAIDDGHLCRYRYFVHTVALDEDEQAEWRDLSARVGRAMAQARGEMSESLRHLLIQRGRIVKGARGKVALAVDLLERKYRDGDAWLVYCDGTEQLAAVRAGCAARGLHTFEYHTATEGDGAAALEEFSAAGGIMLSINCLDEGVDIPRISHALILASSTTRREFIQRRGRVLRQHETKHRAQIHDAIVDAGGFDDPESATFLRRELARAAEFAASAVDSSATLLTLRELATAAGATLDRLGGGEGFEDDQGTDETEG